MTTDPNAPQPQPTSPTPTNPQPTSPTQPTSPADPNADPDKGTEEKPWRERPKNEYGSRRGEGVDPWVGTGRPQEGGKDTEATAKDAPEK